MRFGFLVYLVTLPLAVACGGQSEEGEGSGRGGASGQGGADPSGGDAGTAPGKGGAGSAGGGTAGVGGGCCLLAPVCAPEEIQIAGPGACPEGATCHAVTACCSTIWCASIGQCDAFPVCDPGDQVIEGDCPPDGSCYTRTLCGTTINCRDVECDPDTEYNRQYVAMDPGTCALIDYSCPEYTTHFANDCGCGCEQDASCPRYFNCQPGPDPQPECSEERIARCPFSPIAI
jgi:hypothetical protein